MRHPDRLKKMAGNLACQYKLDLVVLFGSQATGKTHPQSDIDIGVKANFPLHPRQLARLQTALAESLGEEKVEVVDLKTAPPLLAKKVSHEAVLLYESQPGLFSQFKIAALKLYMEAAPLFQLKVAVLKKFIDHD